MYTDFKLPQISQALYFFAGSDEQTYASDDTTSRGSRGTLRDILRYDKGETADTKTIDDPTNIERWYILAATVCMMTPIFEDPARRV